MHTHRTVVIDGWILGEKQENSFQRTVSIDVWNWTDSPPQARQANRHRYFIASFAIASLRHLRYMNATDFERPLLKKNIS